MTNSPKSQNDVKPNRLWLFGLFLFAVLLLFLLNIMLGSVRIPFKEVWGVLMAREGVRESWEYIVRNSRLPRVLTAALAGIALSASGLQMQTMFRNPLADPFILGINSGASLGVALTILGTGFVGGLFLPAANSGGEFTLALAASAGAGAVLALILLVGRWVKNPTTLLILGLMFGHATSAIVSILIYFSAPERIHAYSIWSFGSYSGVNWTQLKVMAIVILAGLSLLLLLPKGLNALLLGEDYARTMGLNVGLLRFVILLSASVLSGAVTAFCGPIGFIGVAVPHLARNIFKTSNHKILIPAIVVISAAVSMAASLIAQLPGSQLMLPINVVTSLFGAPFVVWVLLKRKRGAASFNV